MTNPYTGAPGGPNPAFQPQLPTQPNGPQQGHIPMPPGMGAFDSQLGRPGGQGFPVSQLPPVQQTTQQQPMGQPQLTQQQLQQQQQAQQQGQQWNPFNGPQQQPQQQQAQPQQQAQLQPMQPGQVVMTEQTVLDGPSIPTELRGRTWGEALSIYNGMRNMVLNRQLPQIPQPQPQPQQQPQAPQQPAPQQQPAQQQQGQPQNTDFFRDPIGALRRVQQETQQQTVQQVLQTIQPVLQQSYQQGIQQIRASIANEVGLQRYSQVEPRVLALLSGMGTQELLNPDVWRVAVRTAVGELVMNQQSGPQFQGRQQQAIQQGATPSGQFPIQQQSGNPLPNLGSFFSEAPQSGGSVPGGMQLSDNEKQAAALMNMSEADYAAWKGGIQVGGRR
jgi:hypothetical protein